MAAVKEALKIELSLTSHLFQMSGRRLRKQSCPQQQWPPGFSQTRWRKISGNIENEQATIAVCAVSLCCDLRHQAGIFCLLIFNMNKIRNVETKAT
ncbi:MULTISPECIES: hypothetical protein, partial [unclassified Phaeobacter]|uniref:hypothetical protein n=1 Tax=unclassified Phaeobacter TaxID=2621772 RepID=UPI003A8C7F82